MMYKNYLYLFPFLREKINGKNVIKSYECIVSLHAIGIEME